MTNDTHTPASSSSARAWPLPDSAAQFIWAVYKFIPLVEDLSWSPTATDKNGHAPDRTWIRLDAKPSSGAVLENSAKLAEVEV